MSPPRSSGSRPPSEADSGSACGPRIDHSSTPLLRRVAPRSAMPASTSWPRRGHDRPPGERWSPASRPRRSFNGPECLSAAAFGGAPGVGFGPDEGDPSVHCVHELLLRRADVGGAVAAGRPGGTTGLGPSSAVMARTVTAPATAAATAAATTSDRRQVGRSGAVRATNGSAAGDAETSRSVAMS